MKKAPRKETLTCRSECKGSMVGCSQKHAARGVREAAQGRGKSGNRGLGQEPDSYQRLRLCTPVNRS